MEGGRDGNPASLMGGGGGDAASTDSAPLFTKPILPFCETKVHSAKLSSVYFLLCGLPAFASVFYFWYHQTPPPKHTRPDPCEGWLLGKMGGGGVEPFFGQFLGRDSDQRDVKPSFEAIQ